MHRHNVTATLAIAFMAAGTLAVAAEENLYLKTIPADKNLDPAWVQSLYERGEKEVVSDKKVPATLKQHEARVELVFGTDVMLEAGDDLQAVVGI